MLCLHALSSLLETVNTRDGSTAKVSTIVPNNHNTYHITQITHTMSKNILTLSNRTFKQQNTFNNIYGAEYG